MGWGGHAAYGRLISRTVGTMTGAVIDVLIHQELVRHDGSIIEVIVMVITLLYWVHDICCRQNSKIERLEADHATVETRNMRRTYAPRAIAAEIKESGDRTWHTCRSYFLDRKRGPPGPEPVCTTLVYTYNTGSDINHPQSPYINISPQTRAVSTLPSPYLTVRPLRISHPPPDKSAKSPSAALFLSW